VKTQRLTWLKARSGVAVLAGLGLTALSGASVAVADSAPPGRTVAYVLYHRVEAIYQGKDRDGKDTREECPNGLYEYGPRERFAALFPKESPKKFTLEESALMAEALVWAPDLDGMKEEVPFREAGGKISLGLNLDGKVKPTDFTAPDGTPGIDNQFFRAAGCMPGYREGSSQRLFYEEFLERLQFNRLIIAVSDVDSLENDDDVTVTTYRGLDRMVKDAMGNFQADTTQRVDLEWGQPFIAKAKAKIVNGVVITTQPADEFIFPSEQHSNTATDRLRGANFQLKLEGTKMEGLVGGYLDVETTYRAMNRRFGTHQIAYDKTWSPALYKVMRRLADGYPDPKTGENMAISAAIEVAGVRTKLLFPNDKSSPVPTQIARDVASR